MFTLTAPRFTRPRFLTAFWLVCLCLGLPALAFAQTSVAPTSGDGLTTTTAYQITSLQNLAWMQELAAAGSTAGVYYALANDIDATSTSLSTYDSGAGFLPIGTDSFPFQGTFLGNGHTISNLTLNRTSTDYVGFFGVVSGGAVQDLSLTDATIKGKSCVGGLVGYAVTASTQTIAQCSFSGTVSGSGSFSGTVSGCGFVGGLVGYADNERGTQTISQCYAIGDVTGSSGYVGGLVGCAYTESATQTISQCYATGDVSGSSDYVGGLVGNAYSSDGTQTISQCFATGDVSGSTRVGGLVGYAYNYGGTQMISQSYASGAVSGTSYLGGLVGSAYSGSGTQTFTACYCLTGHGAVNSGTKTGISVVSTSALRTQSTFSGWDFSDDWVIDTTQGFNDGYPYLRAFSALVYSLNINDGATSTTSRTVTLTPVMSPFTTHYAVSENADFSDASWIALDDATTMTYTLSSGVGEKMLYFATYNNNNSYFDNSDDDLSEITTATITLAGITPTVTAFTINSGAASATSAAVTFQNAATGDPTYYKVSDVADLTTATWTAYSTSGNFTLTGANDSKTLYFQVKNDFAESAIVSASINLLAADMSFVKNSVTVQSAHSETYAAKTAVITSKDTYAFKASIQLPSTFASISASTQINITVGDVTFSQPLSAAVSSSLKGAKGGSAVFRTQVLVGKTKKTTQIVTLTWSKAGLLKVVVTGTPVAETGSKVTTNILNALSTDDGSVAANVPIAVGIGSDYARNETGVVCTGTRSTSTVKNTSVSLNKWVMTGKK